MSLTRREFLVRAEQAEHMLAETRRAREAETQAAALAERARIARDIHDVLAHSLAAVSVNLQAAEGLLAADTLPADNPELAKAIECIDRAGTLTREGLAAARRAILALREDAAPLPDQLASLAGQYRAAGDLAVDFTVTGAARPLSEQVSQVAYRTAQEGLTNARKHAPGQPVTLGLGFEPGQVTVSVANPLPPAGGQGPLAATGAGDGLTGLKERAALAGGTLEAGPADGIWRVYLDSCMTENTEPVTVVVADDQSAVREGLVLLLGTLPGIAVIGEAEDGEVAVDARRGQEPPGRAHGPEHAAL